MSSETLPARREPGDAIRQPTPIDKPRMKWNMLPSTFGEAMLLSQTLAKTRMVPECFQGKPDDIMIVMMMAFELGIMPWQAISHIAIINGRPTMWGDLPVALVLDAKAHPGQPLCEYIHDTWDEERKVATVTVKRYGKPEPRTFSFSWKDAERAKLTTKDTYQKFPQRMLMWRALSWALRAEFADVLKGMHIAEEWTDVAPRPEPIAPPRALAPIPATAAVASALSQPAIDVGPAQPPLAPPTGAPADPWPPRGDMGWGAFARGELDRPEPDAAVPPRSDAPDPDPDPQPEPEPERFPALYVTNVVKGQSGTWPAKAGKALAGKPFTSWAITFSDGVTAYTTEQFDVDNAQKAMAEKIAVVAQTKASDRGSGKLELTMLEVASAFQAAKDDGEKDGEQRTLADAAPPADEKP